MDGKAIRIGGRDVDWLTGRSRDRVWRILMSQADVPVRPRMELDTERLGLVADAPITVFTPGRPEGEQRPAGALSDLVVPAKGLVAVSLPAAGRDEFPKLSPLAEGNVVREAGKPWGELHAMHIRSPFGADSILVAFTHGPAEGGMSYWLPPQINHFFLGQVLVVFCTSRYNEYVRSSHRDSNLSVVPRCSCPSVVPTTGGRPSCRLEKPLLPWLSFWW